MENNELIPYGNIWNRFKAHFELEHNSNILFSGKYGIGKTTFLNSYFKERENDIITIKLFPVNYVVNSNDNIFELIKIDIIKQLQLLGEINLEKDLKVSTIQSAVSLALNKPLTIGKHLSKALSKLHPIGEVASTAFDGVYSLIEEFSKYEKELNKKMKFDDNILIEYSEEKANELASYVEYNLVSELISNVINRIQKDKKVVLLIDDLDRLDPEHIFRLLNIFSSHHDYETKKHKFGFDKVILVCHLKNIESIFHHKYGGNTDFNGYIDKFYSDEIFKFDNNDAVDLYLTKLKLPLPDYVIDVFSILLRNFLYHDKLTVRELIKSKYSPSIKPFNYFEYNFSNINNIPHINKNVERLWISSDDVSIIYIFKYLSVIFGSFSYMENAIDQIPDRLKFVNEEKYLSILKSFALIININQNRNNKPLLIFFRNYRDDYSLSIDEGFPIQTCFGVKLVHKLKWNYNNVYNQNESYFSNCEIGLSSNQSENRVIDSLEIKKEIKKILTHIKMYELKDKLQIVS
ncbi:MAG: AAA family ATPase [Flavobacteriales bacterium]|nr:AAA family ATPase [Flavobacteriales bacterium]MCW8914043.1 AAA family ATPase [Flavobacteriales bacterium]MCW8938101.1 AAA family ATPase [Flavobacteriales bacterium]MCW8941121.1 AAA family ATPase [Flavobacteriales bacterium]MCW8968046.1 AAA family ATPase [Flavobacteriales bacterium]